MYEFSNYLAHHGIQGQKWGKRYGPPYPLSPSTHSAAEKKAKNYNAGTLKKWRGEERKKLDKKYDQKIAKQTKALDKLEARYEKAAYNEKRDTKRLKKLRSREDKIWNLRHSKLLEEKAIRHMSLSDVSDERRRVGAHAVGSVLSGVGTLDARRAFLDAELDKKIENSVNQEHKLNKKLERVLANAQYKPDTINAYIKKDYHDYRLPDDVWNTIYLHNNSGSFPRLYDPVDKKLQKLYDQHKVIEQERAKTYTEYSLDVPTDRSVSKKYIADRRKHEKGFEKPKLSSGEKKRIRNALRQAKENHYYPERFLKSVPDGMTEAQLLKEYRLYLEDPGEFLETYSYRWWED